MTTFPLPTLACTVDDTGISSPSFDDILQSLLASFKSIYGQDAYLEPDSQDYEMLSIVAQAQYDSNQATIAAYNNYSPATAFGAGLASVVKINGLVKQKASASTAVVTIIGQAGKPLNNCLIGDDLSLGTQWMIPNNTVIPVGGSIDVTATCTQQGAVSVPAGHLTVILTPVPGWQSVTNAVASIPGAPIETDAALRQRQAASTSLPAETPVEAVFGAVANVDGVRRLKIYENDEGTVDENGIPGHNISVVVEGGDAVAVATAIAQKKTPGTGTFGTTSEIITDSVGVPNTINFFELSLITDTVVVNLRALPGYVSTTNALIQKAIAAFITQLDIGEISYLGRLYAMANLSGDAAVAATGLTQTQLDALAKTYMIASISQSRASNIPVTLVTNGPYIAGSNVIDVADAGDLYVGAPVSVTLDDASTLATTISAISGNSVTLVAAVPAGRHINTGAGFFLTADVAIAFNEAAMCETTDVTVNAS